jgi:hypothetical protein
MTRVTVERPNGEKWPTAPLRFYAIEYKRDFEFVRKMDGLFEPRSGPQLVARLSR